MSEPGDTLLAFIADLKDQVRCFELSAAPRLGQHPLARLILADLKSRLDAEAVVLRHKMQQQERKQ